MSDGVKNINHRYIFDCSRKVSQIAAIGAKKLLVENKITACVKEIIISWVYRVACKFPIQKHCLVKHFAFWKNVCYQYYILGFELLFVLL